MGAGLFVSMVLKADSSPVSGWAGCAGWVVTVLFTFALPPVPPRSMDGWLFVFFWWGGWLLGIVGEGDR